MIGLLATMNPTNICRTQPDHPDARLRSRRYAQTLSVVTDKTVALIPTLHCWARPWKIIGVPRTAPQGDASNVDDGTVISDNTIIHAEVPVLFFTDDLTVTLIAEGGDTRVDVRSASRVGRSDLGENRRHVYQLLHALDKKFGAR